MEWHKLQDERLAVIADLCARAPGGALGRTAVMKLCYFLQILRGVQLGYHFTLYSYGPFDSDVLSDLGTAESMGAVASMVVYHTGGYGYQIKKADRNEITVSRGREFLKQHRASLDWVLDEFGSLGSAALELQSTIVFIDREASRKTEGITLPELAKRVRDVKPHFKEDVILGSAVALYGKHLLLAAQPATARA